jgi:hypothetical protein
MAFESDPRDFGPFDQIFLEFEASSGWHLSVPAKHIIYLGFLSIEIDTLGVGTIASLDSRRTAFGKAVKLLPKFLWLLKSNAEKQKPNEHHHFSSKEIGGIFVLQHADAWRTLFGCSCWPI